MQSLQFKKAVDPMHYIRLATLRCLLAFVLAAMAISCGGGKGGDSTTTTPAVTAKAPVSIALTSSNAIIYVGTTQQIALTATYADGTTAALSTGVTWTSDSAKASVNASGVVSPVSAGEVNLKATVGSVFGSLKLTVKGPYAGGTSGGSFSVFQKYDGTFATTGSNLKGQLGDQFGNRNVASVLTPAADSKVIWPKWKMVAASTSHTLAVGVDGTLWSWGSNSNGQLGDGVNSERSTAGPVQIGALKTWDSVAVGKFHSLAILVPNKTDKTLWAWGSNSNGQLGDGSNLDSNAPKQVGVLKNWTSITAGDTHSAAVNALGEVYTWGGYINGQLGQGASTTADVKVPTKVAFSCASCVPKRVVAGANHNLIWMSDHTLYAFGANDSGQLGLGSTTTASIPTQIGTDNNWDSLAAGTLHSLATKVEPSGGVSLWAWGSNSNGQLGDGTTTDQRAPTQIGTTMNWKGVFAGAFQSFAWDSDGNLWAWGSNLAGQLGLGTSTDATIPTKVP